MSVYVKNTLFIACNCVPALLHMHSIDGEPLIFECIKCNSVWSNRALDKLRMSDFESAGFQFRLLKKEIE